MTKDLQIESLRRYRAIEARALDLLSAFQFHGPVVLDRNLNPIAPMHAQDLRFLALALRKE